VTADERRIYTWCNNCERKCGCGDCLRMLIDGPGEDRLVGRPRYYKGP
jgi:hypothetical protein